MTDNAAVTVTVKAGRSCVGDAFLGHQVAVAHWLVLFRVGVSGCWVFLVTW